MTLRTKLIRLAHENPDLRLDLLPLLSKEAEEERVLVRKDLLREVRKAQSDWRNAMTRGATTSTQEKAEEALNRALGRLFEDAL